LDFEMVECGGEVGPVRGQVGMGRLGEARADYAVEGARSAGDSYYEEIMNKTSCLSLLSNAVLVWNTIKISNIVG
jgi:hypothetical protein